MIVEMKKEPEAYGIYAGGQSGNPGSRYYDNFITPWASGTYYRLRLMNREEARKLNGLGIINLKPKMTR